MRTDRRRGRVFPGGIGLVALAAVLASLAAAGCGWMDEEYVCPQEERGEKHVVVVPSTSETDYPDSLKLTPDVVDQAAARAARACGRLSVGILDGRPDSNLELRSRRLSPEDPKEKAVDPDDKTDDLADEGEEFAEEDLIAPLEAHGDNGGSPFISGLAKIGEEVAGQGWPLPTVILIGDGLVVEPSPVDGEMINFGREEVDPERLSPFVPLLQQLEGACVLLVGAGATSEIPGERIRASQDALEKVLGEAGVEFVAVLSPTVPESC